MWMTSRTPYLEQAERIAALTTPDDIWLLVSSRGPARTVVAIGPKTIVCDGGDVTVYDAPADIPQADLTREQHLTLEHFDDLVRGWYTVNHMPYRLAALVQPPRLHPPMTASQLSISTAGRRVWVVHDR